MDLFIKKRFGSPNITNVYIIQLQEGKYYVGNSNDVKERYQQHVEGKGSGWTRLFKPISLIQTINDCDKYDEDKYTKKMMSIYGINNVRGGSYTNIVLSNAEIVFIQKEIWSAENKCCRCGNYNHWVKDCKERLDINGKWIL
jgi:hypothetical protein